MNLQINDDCYTLVCTADGTPMCGDDASKIAYMRDKGNYDEYFPQLHLLKQLTLWHHEFFFSALPVQAGPGLQWCQSSVSWAFLYVIIFHIVALYSVYQHSTLVSHAFLSLPFRFGIISEALFTVMPVMNAVTTEVTHAVVHGKGLEICVYLDRLFLLCGHSVHSFHNYCIQQQALLIFSAVRASAYVKYCSDQ